MDLKLQYWEDGRKEKLRLDKVSRDFVNKEFNNGIILKEFTEVNTNKYNKVKDYQLSRISSLVKYAYQNFEIYRQKYKKAGITLEDINNFSWDTYKKLPIITKDELRSVKLNKRELKEKIYYTHSSGTSGKVVKIPLNLQTITLDTINGIAQYKKQTNQMYDGNWVVLQLYTEPWWIQDLNGSYRTVFVSSLIEKSEQLRLLSEIRPDILSIYPSNLDKLYKEIPNEVLKKIKLIITNSEHSTQVWRDEISLYTGINILDEYSSEELTRIALQFFDKKYYICEEMCRVDILNKHLRLSEVGRGDLIGTNLINCIFPLIKYNQGDVVNIAFHNQKRIIKKIEGRKNDEFKLFDGKVISSGTLLDLTYRVIIDLDLKNSEFQLIQNTKDSITFKITKVRKSSQKALRLESIFKENLERLCGQKIKTIFEYGDIEHIKGKKRRMIISNVT